MFLTKNRVFLTFMLLCSLLLANCISVQAQDVLSSQGREKAYTLTQVDSAGENTITKFEMVEGVMTPVYYRVDLAKTEYSEGDNSMYFEWIKNSDGNNEFKEVSTPTEGKTTITVRYDSAINQRVQNYKDISSTPITGDFIALNNVGHGGAILNYGTIGDITGDFVGNYTTKNWSAGGAIFNERGTIGDIIGDFIGNYASSSSSGVWAGAIYNRETIGNITGDFIGNYAFSYSNASGGAIFNEKTIGAKDENGNVVGGIINSNFINNYAKAESTSADAPAKGGAIYTISNLNIIADNGTSLFSGNKTIEATNKGSANEKTVETPNAIYVHSNNATLKLHSVNNGTIQFDDQIDGVSGYALNLTGDNSSKVILNNDIINANVTLENTNLVMGKENIFDKSQSLTLNSGTVDMQNGKTGTVATPELNINGNINVKLDADLSGAGSIDNFGSSNINGNGTLTINSVNIIKDFDNPNNSLSLDFINTDAINTILADSAKSYMTSKYTYEIGKIDNNTLSFAVSEDLGGIAAAIANKPPVTEYFITEATEVINGWSVISGNEMQGKELNIHGNGNNLDGNGNKGILIGAGKTMNIENVGKFVITETDETNPNAFQAFDKNGELKYYTTEGTTGWTNFKNTAIKNYGTMNITNTVFINNSNETERNTLGSAIYNNGTIENISASFISNHSHTLTNFMYPAALGGAIYNEHKSIIKNISGNFIGNYTDSVADGNPTSASSRGGAVFNLGIIGNISGLFVNNASYSNSTGGSYAEGGAIYNSGTIGNITGDFIGNTASSNAKNAWIAYSHGGAIRNGDTIGLKDENGKVTGGIINSNFLNNTAIAVSAKTNAQAQGGAIYTSSDLNIIADNGTSLFSGNKTIETTNKGTADEKTVETRNAIYVATFNGNIPELTLQAVNQGTIQFDDQIDGDAGYSLQLTGDDKSKILLNNSVKNANVTMETTNVNLGQNDVFATSNVTVNSGTLGFVNGIAEAQTMQSLNIAGTTNLALDVDLAGEKMDTLPSGTVVSPDANINVSYLNLLNDALKDKTIIAFAPEDYANQIQYTGENPIAYSKIYKYDVGYQINPDSNLGEFIFARGNSSNPSDNFNPSVLAPSVATQAGAYTTQLQTFNYAFQHSDAFMNIPYLDRMAIKNRNKYALSPTADATDVGTFSPLLTKEEAPGFWLKPYASFENIPLKNGPKVSNINYGTLVGYDSSLKSISHGFDRVLTGYIGYNGASQRYSGVDAYQNGGILGGTATFYKNNFFNATTLSVGATAGDAKTMYGSENYTMLLAGIANKTGYNFEFNEGRIILQPSMLISYSFVNTFDYNNAAGVRIKSDPLNALQLAPGIKLIGNTKNGWQPYIGVSMIWNLLDKSKVTADDVRLPEMSIKPYVQYGVGLQKRFNDKFTAYGQAMIHSGGRNGVSLSAGFKWAVGKK